MADDALQADPLPTMPCRIETIATIPGDIGCRYIFDAAGLAIVAAFATYGVACTPFLAGFGNAIDCAAGAVAGVTGVCLRQSIAVSEFDFAIDMVLGSVTAMAGVARGDARTLVGGIEVAGVRAGGEIGRRNSVTGSAHAALAVAPLGRDVDRLAWLLAAGSAIGMAKAVGAGQIDAIERTLSRHTPEIGEIHLHLFLEVDMVIELGDAVVVVVLSGVRVTFIAADGVSAPVTEQRRQVAGVAAGTDVELIAMATGAGQCTVFVPDRRSEFELIGAGIAIAVTTEGGASAVAAVVAATGVEAVEEDVLETERLSDMTGVSGIRGIMAGAALNAILIRSIASVFLMGRQVFVQTVGWVSGRWWWGTVTGRTRRHEGIFSAEDVVGVMAMAGGAIGSPQILATSRAVVAAGEQCGLPNMAGRTEIVLIIFVRIVETVLACGGKEGNGITIDNRQDDGNVVAAMSGVTLVTGGAERTFDSVVVGLIAVGGRFVHCRQIRAFEEGVPTVAARNERLLAAVVIMAVLAEGREIGLIGIDEAQTGTAIGHPQVDIAIAVGALIMADNALVVGQRAQNMMGVLLEIIGHGWTSARWHAIAIVGWIAVAGGAGTLRDEGVGSIGVAIAFMLVAERAVATLEMRDIRPVAGIAVMAGVVVAGGAEVVVVVAVRFIKAVIAGAGGEVDNFAPDY